MMKSALKLGMVSVLLSVFGCATVPPVVVSAGQQQAFDGVVHQAESEGATVNSPEAAQLLCNAKDEFAYGQRTPKYPDRERATLARAQKDAEKALALIRRARQRQNAENATARQEMVTAVVGP
ncbi:MAG TPA: hypothetical protein VH374_15560 [Polyangia bacterium]|nr:hypothetical protein [Polyangia bacterium]